MRIAVLAALALLAGCAGGNPFIHGSAQERRADTARGGVIALFGNHDKALAQAQTFMAERCGPASYRIVSEEQVQTGQARNAWAGGQAPSELRVTYECAAPAAAR